MVARVRCVKKILLVSSGLWLANALFGNKVESQLPASAAFLPSPLLPRHIQDKTSNCFATTVLSIFALLRRLEFSWLTRLSCALTEIVRFHRSFALLFQR